MASKNFYSDTGIRRTSRIYLIMKEFKFNIFNTLYQITFSFKVTKRVPKYATVKPETKWIYAGYKLKVDSVYTEAYHKAPERGRALRLSLEGTKFQVERGYKSTVIDEIDLILHY